MEFNKVKIKHIALSNNSKKTEIYQALNDVFLKENIENKSQIQKYRFLAGSQEILQHIINAEKKSTRNVLCFTPILYEKSLDLENLEIELESKYIFEIPEKCDPQDAVCLMMSAVKVYSDIFFKGRCIEKEKVLIVNGATDFGYLALQVLSNLNCEIYTSVNNKEEYEFLSSYLSNIEMKIIKLYEENIVNSIKSINFGIGMDCVIAYENLQNTISTREIIEILSPNGRWITHNLNLQIDPPESKLLFLKNCILAYSFEDSYELYGLEYGKIHLVILESLEALNEGKLKIIIKNQYDSIKQYEESNSMSIGSSIINLNK